MKTVEQTVACLLRQLLELHTVLPDPIVALFNAHKETHFLKKPPMAEEWTSLLLSTMSAFSKVFMVVDALDEYPSKIRSKFLTVLNHLKPSHLLVTSREHIRLGHVIPRHKMISIQAKEEDITAYIHSRLETFHLAWQIDAKPELKDEIVSTVVSNARDLYVHLLHHQGYDSLTI
jgi:hypothetical protein